MVFKDTNAMIAIRNFNQNEDHQTYKKLSLKSTSIKDKY